MLADEQISLRLGTSEDSDFVYYLHRAAMQQYVAQTWGWDEAWQWNYFQQHFNPAECQIITFEGRVRESEPDWHHRTRLCVEF